MISLLFKSVYYNLSRIFTFLPRLMPLNITVSLTFNCNSRCRTCNVWTRKVSEFTLSEFEKTFKSIGRGPYWFTLSGGEPFLRTDIVKICKSVYEHCRPKVINIPTNGILYDVIPQKVKDICLSLPKIDIVINLSIDGVGEKHDKIRGVPGNYDKAMKTLQALKELNLPNLTVGIMTVVSNYNIKDLPQIWEEIVTLNPDSYVTEIAEEREELLNAGKGITPSYEDYENALGFLQKKLGEQKFGKFSTVIQAFRLVYYDLVKRIIKEKRQVIPCMAGLVSAQIAPDGDVWFCCMEAKSIGNLRQENYDFKKIWNGKKAIELRKNIKNGACFCPLANVSYTNILCSPSALLKVFFAYLKLKFGRGRA